MANFNTFPHVDADDLNLDWLLEQYATFNDRIAEILAHFDEVAEEMRQQNEHYKNQVLALFNNYKNYVDAQVASMNNKVDELKDAVDQINEKTDEYVYNYLQENITEILQDNPVLETKYEKLGYIDTNETVQITLEANMIYEIMTIDYALASHKALAVNNAFKITQVPFESEDAVTGVVASELLIPDIGTACASPLTLFKEGRLVYNPLISGTSNNNVLTITNLGINKIRVYAKIIGEL